MRYSHINALACDAIADGNTLFQAAVQSFRAGFVNVGVTAAAVRGMARRDANGNFYLEAPLQEDLINGRSEPDGTWTLRPPVSDGLLYVLGRAATHDVAVTYQASALGLIARGESQFARAVRAGAFPRR